MGDEGASGGRERLLLVGWEGALAPVPGKDAGAGEPEVLGSWMAEARRFAARISTSDSGATLPLEQLVGALRRRLMGVFAMPVAMGFGGLTGEQRAGLERVTGAVLEDWRAGVGLFARRLRGCSAELARWMGVAELPEIISLGAASSDVHGPSGVGIQIEFAGGETVFYKARPVTGEVFWAELQGRLAEIDLQAGVRAARALTGRDQAGEFGWMECLPRSVCEEGRHWRRAGALLCAAMATGLSDLHMANIVATADGPAVVDAECLGGLGGWAPGDGEGMEGELLGTGLLPFGDLPDVSGLFGGGASVSGVRVPRWGADGAVEFVGAGLVEQGNRLAGSERAPLACLPEMLDGFRCAAEAICGIRRELLTEGGWVERMEASHRPRVVFRSTLEYGLVMSRTLFPEAIGFSEVIGSEVARERAVRRGLAELGPRQGGAEGGGVEEAEVRALLRLCVPRFTMGGGGGVQDEGGLVFGGPELCAAEEGGVRGRIEGMSPGWVESGGREALAGVLFQANSGQRWR